MTARGQWAVVGVVVAVLAVGLGIASHFMKDQLFPVEVGSKLPDFRAKDLATNQVKSLSDYKGKVLLLNVWATFCEPCKQEIPSLQSLYKTYGDSGLKLVAVSVDDAVSEDSIKAYARNFGITFDVLHDPSHEIERVLQTTGYPETFVVGPEGTIRKKWIGADNWSSQGNRALIAQLLGLQTPKPVAETGAGASGGN